MKAYTLQLRVSTQDFAQNLSKIESFLPCVDDGSLLLLPEMFSCGFDYEKLEAATEFSEEALSFLRAVSESKALLVCGSLPVKEGGRIYNRAFLLQDGEVLGWKDKMMLFPLTEEDKHFAAGRENPVFNTKMGRVGILVCFELRFPELVAQLKQNRCELVLVPAQWGLKRKEHLIVLSKARAIETQSYLVLSNSWGTSGGQDYAGCSAIYSPWGETLAFAERGDVLLYADIDLKEVKKLRRYLPLNVLTVAR